MSDVSPKTSPLKKPTVAPAHKAGGMRVGNPHPHPHKEGDTKRELTDDEKKQAAHDALALSNQLFEIDAISSEDKKHSGQSKAIAANFTPPEQKPYQNNRQHGAKGNVQQPGGGHACNNYLH